MKKVIIFAVAVTLSGAAFAGGLEDFKSQLSLKALNAETISSADIIMPTGIQGDIKEGVESDKPKYFLQTDGYGNWFCGDESGKEGRNKVTVEELKEDLRKGECASLRGVNLSGVDLSGANLSGADLRWSNLIAADLSGANLKKADLSGAELNGDLSGAYMVEAILVGADLGGANLIGAHLREADLRDANLIKADLSGADLKRARLNKANLKDAKLVKADLRGAYMREANLKGADLYSAYMYGTGVTRAEYNDKTTLPYSDVEAKRRGMIKVD